MGRFQPSTSSLHMHMSSCIYLQNTHNTYHSHIHTHTQKKKEHRHPYRSGSEDFTDEFLRKLQRKIETKSFLKTLFLKKEEGTFSDSVYEHSITLVQKPDKHIVLVAVIKYFHQKPA